MNINKTAIGQSIKEHRNKSGYTQERLAELLDISPAYLKHLEAGRRIPSVNILYKAAKVLNMSMDHIFFPSNDKTLEMQSKVTRKLNDCTPYELNIIYSIIEAILDNRPSYQ